MNRHLDAFGKELFQPPYRFLPWAVFFFFLFCSVVHPNGAIRTGMFADTDDYMRLDELINWFQGQSWFDLSHPRLSPGMHTVVHWSRLLDLPLALFALPFVNVMGMANAAMLASFIVPPLTFALLLPLVAALARPFVGAERANLATLMVLFAPMVIMNFVPGRVDHHGYEVLVAGFGVLCLERMVTDDKNWRAYAIAAAITFACGLWIGTEALPWMLLFIGCLGVMTLALDGEMPLRAAFFGVCLAGATALVLPLAVAPAEYQSLALSWYSLADVLLAALVAILFFVYWGVIRVSKKSVPLAGRFVLMALLVAGAAYLFMRLVPSVQGGPFADYDDFDSTVALANIGEAQPLAPGLIPHLRNHAEAVAALLGFIQLMLLPLCGLAACGVAVRRANTLQQRLIVGTHSVFLATSMLLTLFWQIRVGWFMQFFAIVPITYLLVTGWDAIGRRYTSRPRFWLELGLFLALGFLPVVLVPTAAHDEPVWSNVMLFPAARPATVCPLRTASDFLSQSWGYGGRRHVVLSGANEGPELLFRTLHDVIAANFNVAGNLDVYNFFGAREDAEAKAIAHKWHADLVLACRSIPLGYARLKGSQIGKTAFLTTTKEGTLGIVSNPEHPTLIERLAQGKAPSWLKPIEIPGDKDYLLFEVLNR